MMAPILTAEDVVRRIAAYVDDRGRCISIQEMVGKLRAAMDAKQALDPDFVIMARCDLGGVPGASFDGDY